jgi:dolichol kinase
MRNPFRPVNPHPSPEEEMRRLKRNFQELIQEISVVLFSVQILFGFLFGMVFMPRFTAITPIQRKVHLAAMVAAAVTLVLLLAPVAWHRFLWRRHRKAELVGMSNLFFIAGLFCLLFSIGAAIWLVVAVTWGDALANYVTLPVMAFCTTLWLALPLWLRHHSNFELD